ncbi:DUF2946 family protein [Cupriavidus basilensis]|uniref:DUF2946 family protein n=1 Tax=Cupriavidus TaxID=106589 RepID=UPI00044D7DF3|nr:MULTISPECIES: DUF2946 family protein [Cupriavidus]KDP85430.1 hypothetical protein CF70_013645 [Cupriavidus sp. SK-3]MDF3885380.1 DUF2946 family protein [Cupriavidus basilensis]
MDDSVKQAMARWPNVPNCYGWLALDRRGQWRMRNEYAQQHGLSGDPIRHEALIAFIERNYQHDERGAWYFQNGPQRVFVSLAYAPWIARLHQGQLRTTSQRAFTLRACHADEHGNVLLAGEVEGESGDAGKLQVALLHDHDLDAFSSACTWHGEACGGNLGVFHFDGTDVAIEPIVEDEVPTRYGFVRQPLPPAGEQAA